MTPEEMEETLKIEVSTSEPGELNNSRFIGIAVDSHTHEETRQVYKKLKMLHGGTRLIVCGYSVSSPDQTWGEGFCNDGEHGAGRHLLNIIKNNNLRNVSLFGIRYYGGIHLGQRRFTIYKQVAASALHELHPDLNEDTLGKHQQQQPQGESQFFGTHTQRVEHKSFHSRSIRGGRQHNSRKQSSTLPKPSFSAITQDLFTLDDNTGQSSAAFGEFNFSKPLQPFKASNSWGEG